MCTYAQILLVMRPHASATVSLQYRSGNVKKIELSVLTIVSFTSLPRVSLFYTLMTVRGVCVKNETRVFNFLFIYSFPRSPCGATHYNMTFAIITRRPVPVTHSVTTVTVTTTAACYFHGSACTRR